MGIIGFGWTGCDGALVLAITAFSIIVSMPLRTPLPALTFTLTLTSPLLEGGMGCGKGGRGVCVCEMSVGGVQRFEDWV